MVDFFDMNEYLKNIFTNFLTLTNTRFYIYYFLIIIGSYFFVFSGFDWKYLIFVSSNIPNYFLFIADVLGFTIPVLLIVALFIFYKAKNTNFSRKIFLSISETIIFSFLTTTIIKIFTGRESPPHAHGFISQPDISSWVDNSYNFHFGFMREQVIGGFPSGHSTVIFSLAFLIYFLFPKRYWLQVFSFLVATFIGLGVTFGFHWFSEFYSGAILGFVIARIVSEKNTK